MTLKKIIRIFKRFFHILKFLIKYVFYSKIYFKNPPKKKIILFDCDVPNYIKNLFSKKESLVLSTRSTNISEIYISKSIIFFLVNNFFKRSIKKNYLIILIKLISPKVVYTFIDNSPDFYDVSKELENEIKFVAIQQSTRETRWLPFNWLRNINLPIYYCLSEWDKSYYIKKKTNVKKFLISGSLKSSLALNYIKSKNIKINKKKFDICIIGERDKIWIKGKSHKYDVFKNRDMSTLVDGEHIKKLSYSAGQIARYAYKFCKKFKLKMVIAGRSEKDSALREEELDFYKYYLGTDDFNLIPNQPEKFSNYILTLQSRLIIGNDSTLIREAIGMNKKIFACNYSGHSDLDFVEKKLKKFCTKKNSYEIFEKKVLNILNISEKNYFKYLGKNKDYIMPVSTNFHKKFKNTIHQIINT